MSHKYEIEIKSLLGAEENAKNLLNNLKQYDKDLKFLGKNSQLNHYFNIPDDKSFFNMISSIITDDKKDLFDKVAIDGKKISLRTREVTDSEGKKVILVMKASVDDGSSSNAVKRIEFEIVLPMTLNELDKIILNAGGSYQAKWSRQRDEYKSGDINICIDKNAGYGYLAEFEKVITDESRLEETKIELLLLMKKLNVEELPQDRLERMFAYYNANWNDYYGTEKVFIIN